MKKPSIHRRLFVGCFGLTICSSCLTAGVICYSRYHGIDHLSQLAADSRLAGCIGLTVLVAAFIALLGSLLASDWMQRPFMEALQRLQSRLMEQTHGNGVRSCRPSQGDEFEQLEACLDEFMARMKQYNDKLKEQVRRRIAIQQELGESRILFDTFMQHLPALAFIKDDKGRYVYLNEAWDRIFRQEIHQMLGKTDAGLWPEKVSAVLQANDKQVLTKGQVLHTIEQLKTEKGRKYYMVVKFPLARNGNRRWLAGIAFDITDKIQAENDKAKLEAQLVQAQKMEAIGALAGGIAHDFNNILAAIMGYLEIARMDLEPGHPVQNRLEQVLNAANRAKDLVKRILTFSRKNNQDRQPVDLVGVARDALKLLRASLPSNIEIREKINISEAIVVADVTQMHQVIMNLFTNASHALEDDGGQLSLLIDNVVIHDPGKNGHVDLPPGKYILLQVSDTGHGIPEAIQDRIFEPYFTTKPKGKGTGMGLAVVHGIVKGHSGVIKLKSKPGQGTSFTVYLPEAEEMFCPLPQREEKLVGGVESILFVDDEQALAELGGQMLSRLGYKVEIRTSALEALAAFRDHPGKYDMVITDLTMPNMTGDVLAGKLIELRADLPVILCTGYSARVNHLKAGKIGVAAFLYKPLSVKELSTTVRNILDQNRRPRLMAQ